MLLGDRIKAYIKAKNITVVQAARELGISRAHLYTIMKSGYAHPKMARKIEKWSKGTINAKELSFPPLRVVEGRNARRA